MKNVFFIASYTDYDLIKERITDIHNYFLDQQEKFQPLFPRRYLTTDKILSERKKFSINKKGVWHNITFHDTGKTYLIGSNGASIAREMISASGNKYTSYLEEKEAFDRRMMDDSNAYIVINKDLDLIEEDLIQREVAYASLFGLEEIKIPENILYGKTKKL